MSGKRLRRAGLLVGIAAAAIGASPAQAQAPRATRAIVAQDLAGALSQLARDTNIELLFDRRLAAGRRAGAVSAGLTAEQALARLLAGTGFTYRRLDAGSYVIQAPPAAAEPEPRLAEQAARVVTEVAELLVVGKKTLNADLRRSSDDIQPYQVFGAPAIEASQSKNIEDFLRENTGAQTITPTFSQEPRDRSGSAQSAIDLRGLGVEQTVVLIDGRRMPSNPVSGVFGQSDINGLSPGDIDRIEVLGLTAGGIFGIGATGGAVNLVLKREFEGAEARLNGGVTSRGDARRWEGAGRIGLTGFGGRTRLMVSAAYAQDEGLEFGDRDFILEARRRRAQQMPSPREAVASSSINFSNSSGQTLTLIPALGGGSLNATMTSLPLDAPAFNAGGAALLLANAGQYDISLSPDGQGARQSLVTPSHRTSMLATLRQTLGPRLEAYADIVWMENDGHANVPALDTTTVAFQQAPGNPFSQDVVVTYPTTGLVGRAWTLSDTYRLSAGVIARLSRAWTLNLDAATGRSEVRTGLDAIPTPNRLADMFDASQGGAALADFVAGLRVRPISRQRNVSQLDDVVLRAAGPIVRLPAGVLSLTVTAEQRRETLDTVSEGLAGAPDERFPQLRRDVSSLFMEARAPIFGKDASVAALRGLDLQLALRADRYSAGIPEINLSSFTGRIGDRKNRATIVATTFGVRVEPVTGLTLRASFSTGATAPSPDQLIEAVFEGVPVSIVDPKRPAATPSFELVDVSLGGSAALRPQRATTVSLGVIAQPAAVPGLRVSIDYSRLRTDREISNFAQIDFQYFVDNEAAYTDRVTRAPLTPADMALGYAAGRITGIDTRLLQVGRSELNVVDFAVDYQRAVGAGEARLYARATWTPSFRRRQAPERATYDLVGHADGPLRWRGNVGAEWTRGGWSTGLNVQVFGPFSGYLARPPTYIELSNFGGDAPTRADGVNARIPAQAYLDWTLCWRTRAPGGRAELEYRFGVRNVFDTRPPVAAGSVGQFAGFTGGGEVYDYNPLGGYSPMGDARGRRFEVSIVSRF